MVRKRLCARIATQIFLVGVILSSSAFAAEDSLQYWLTQAGMKMSMKEFAEAKTRYVAALRFDSLNVEAIRNLGVISSALGDQAQALVYLQKAYKLKPTDAQLSNNIGAIYSEQKRSAEALQYFEAAVRLDTANALFLANLGIESLRAGHPQQALGVLKRGLALDTANAVISFNMGNAFAAQQMYDSAVFYYEHSKAHGGEAPDLYYYLGVVKRNKGDMAGAEAAFKGAIGRNAQYKEAFQALGLLYAQQGKFDQAAAQFERVVAIDSTFMPGMISLGASYALCDRKKDADGILKRLFAVDSAMGYQMLKLIQLETSKQPKAK